MKFLDWHMIRGRRKGLKEEAWRKRGMQMNGRGVHCVGKPEITGTVIDHYTILGRRSKVVGRELLVSDIR
jgi:hypothetical protein